MLPSQDTTLSCWCIIFCSYALLTFKTYRKLVDLWGFVCKICRSSSAQNGAEDTICIGDTTALICAKLDRPKRRSNRKRLTKCTSGHHKHVWFLIAGRFEKKDGTISFQHSSYLIISNEKSPKRAPKQHLVKVWFGIHQIPHSSTFSHLANAETAIGCILI